MPAGKVTVYLFALVCLVLSGCTLNETSERGEICPPGMVKGKGDHKYISLPNMNCYLHEVELPQSLFKDSAVCTECNDEADAHGFMTCSGDITECFPELKQEYGHCLHYRKHGILDAGDKEPLRVEFYWNVEDDAPTGSLSGEDLGAMSCPAEYPVCIYHEDFKSTIRKDDIPGAYGCTELCNSPKLHCGDGDDRKCINPYTSNEFCGAKGSCSGENEHGEHYRGDACAIDGKQCIDGTCSDCQIGEALCDDGKCADLKRSVEHCGSCGNACAAGEICVNGVCAVDKCPEKDHVCSLANADCAESQNSSEACGKSCIDCTKLPNVAEAECGPDGECSILRCNAHYYIYRDAANGIEQCRMTTNSMCAPQDGTQADISNCLTRFEHGEGECVSGECVITQCDPGYVVSDDGGACVEPGCEGCSSETERCFQGRCLCAEGYANCGKTAGCVNLMDDSDHCGGCRHSCEDALNVSSMDGYVAHECLHSVCTLTECEPQYYIADNRCVPNDDENCGCPGKGCYTDGVAVAHCDVNNGLCVIDQCVGQYHIYEEICERDTTEHCGKHGLSCHIEGSDAVGCQWDEAGNPYCVTESCQEGYHLTNHPEEGVYPAQICEPDDDVNCGKHGNTCPENTKCVNVDGLFTCKCNDPVLDLCSKVCVNFKTDKENCGGCENKCPNNQTCSSAQCGCYDGSENCSGICIHTKAEDKKNCGGCGIVCPNNQTCSNGVCGCYGVANCGGNCIDIQGTDKNNCGGCGSVCPNNQTCSSGVCGCYDGLDNCSGTCKNTKANDKDNCGGCGKKCPNNQTCSSGVCGCGSLANCNGTCIDTKANDKNNCGGCGKKCPNNQTCSSGACGCGSLANCSGTCIDTKGNDVNNCGGCGTKCNVANANNSCSNGTCKFTCHDGFVSNGKACVRECSNGDTKCDGLNYKVCENYKWVTKKPSGKDLILSRTANVFSTPGGNHSGTINYDGDIYVKVHYVSNYGGKDYLRISSPFNGWVEAYNVNLYGIANGNYKIYNSNNEADNTQTWDVYLTEGRKYQLRCGCQRWAPHYGSDVYGWAPDNWFREKAPDLSGIPRCNL